MKKNTNAARNTRNTFDPGVSRAMNYTPMYTPGYEMALATKSVKSFKMLENAEREAAGEEIPSLKNCANQEGFVWQTILKEFGSYYSNYEDLYEEGMLAIIRASSKYDASCGTKTTYFYPYIKHAMFRWVSENVMMSTTFYAECEIHINRMMRTKQKDEEDAWCGDDEGALMGIWAVSKTTISGKDKKISKRFFNAKDEAIMYARSTVMYADLMGYEKIPGDSKDEVIIYQKGDKVIEYRVYHADGFKQTEDIKTSAYKYGDNIYLEVMHDFENKVAALYAYNPLMPETKVCLSKTDISKTNLSDQEILGFNMENLEERITEIQKEIWNQ